MRRRGGGVILNNASICASQPLWYEPIYNVTKAALVFSKTLANEVVKDNIRVNAINPGLVLTPDWVKTAKQLTEGKGGDYEAICRAWLTSTRRSGASPRRTRWPTSSSSCARPVPATRWARPTSWMAGC